MKYFFDTVETIEEGVGFPLFGRLHLLWLSLCLLTLFCNYFVYRRSKETGRKRWRKVVAWLLVADELYKTVILLCGGRYNVDYLPFHLCSINIFAIAIHAYKPSKTLDNFLYTVCIPGALAALLFPSWTSLPITSGMHQHSFTVHILLVLYPAVLAICGDIKPDLKSLPKSLALLIMMAIPIYFINLGLNTNFMFLMYAEPGNPLYLFDQLWGNHLLGFPVIITGVLLIAYGPLLLFRKLRKKAL